MKLSDHIARRGRSIDFTALGFYLPNPDPVLRARGGRIELYRELRTDAHVGGCVRRRKSAVKALEWGLDRGRARSRVAREVEAIFADLDLERLIGEAMDAVLYGYQPLEILWRKAGSLIVPAEVIGKPPEWFHFDAENALRFKTRDNPVHGEELPPMKFLLPRQDATYQNPYWRHDHVVHQGRDNFTECTADNDPYRHIDHIATHGKCLEFTHKAHIIRFLRLDDTS